MPYHGKAGIEYPAPEGRPVDEKENANGTRRSIVEAREKAERAVKQGIDVGARNWQVVLAEKEKSAIER